MKTQRINQLVSNIDNKKRKYTLNLGRYLDDPTISLDSFEQNGSSYYNNWNAQDYDLKKPAQYNIVRSCIDSLVSKLSANKVRPYIHPIDGGYLSSALDRKLRQFFDVYFENQNISCKVIEAFRQALIFDTSFLFINPFTFEIENLPAYRVGFDSNEVAYGQPQEVVIKYNNYPASFLDITTEKQYVQLVIAISCKEHKAFKYVDGEIIDRVEYKSDELPLVSLYYEKPVNGLRTFGLADALEGIQEQIDILSAKISAANELSPATTTYVVEGSSLNSQKLNNKTGSVYSVKLPEGTSSLPVMSVTSPGFDMNLIEQLKYFIQSAYEITGISLLSAQAKKPAGVDSGVAIATLADLESERFQVQQDNYVNAYKDLTKLLIKVLPDDLDILPETEGIFKWKDAKKQLKNMKVLFGADSILSKEPMKKLEQISQISQIGALDINDMIENLDSTDLEGVYRSIGAKINGANAVLVNAIENGVYSIPQYVSYEELKKRILTEENAITANVNLKKEDIKNLMRLQSLDSVLDFIIKENGAVESIDQEVMQSEESGLTGFGNNDLVGSTNETMENVQETV